MLQLFGRLKLAMPKKMIKKNIFPSVLVLITVFVSFTALK